MSDVNTLSIELKEEVVLLTFCKNVGWSGVGLYALALVVAGAHLYIAAEYFRNVQVEGAWVFFLFAGFSFSLVLYHLVVWKKLAQEVKHRSATRRAPKDEIETKLTLFQKAAAFKAAFDMNGKHFLRKLYASEIMESAMQGYNLATLYTCALPPGVVLALCLLLCLDHVHRTYFLWQPHTAQRRDAQVLVDLCVDLLCMILPLAFMWFGFEIPLTVGEMLTVVALPTVFVLSKLDELMEENVRRRSSVEVVRLQRTRSVDMDRRRSSLFQKTMVERGVDDQGKTIGQSVKCAMTVGTAASGLFFLVTGILSVAISPDCDPFLWDACVVKVPLCQFQVACNCAVLHVKKHNATALPPSIGKMTAMKKLQINHGPLRTLPEVGDFMPLLAYVNLDFNRLTTLPASLAKAENLAILYAAFNEIASIPKDLFRHDGIVNLDLSTNRIAWLPEMGIKYLISFHAANNSLATLPESLCNHQYIVTLVVDGNRLKSLPSNVGNSGNTLTFFGASRNNLTVFPSSFRRLGNLVILDVRNNSLGYLPDWFEELLSLTQLTVGGNPLCTNGWAGSGNVKKLMDKEGEGCTRQCSDMCLESTLYDQGVCGHECSIPECDTDKKQCIN